MGGRTSGETLGLEQVIPFGRLVSGIQAALFAQQMAAQQQLETMRRALPSAEAGSGPSGGVRQPSAPAQGGPGNPEQRDSGPTGQYL